MSRAPEVKPRQPAQTAPPQFAVRIVCADDGADHLVPDEAAAAVFVFGGRATAACGHKVNPAPLLQRARTSCGACPEAAAALGLTLP